MLSEPRSSLPLGAPGCQPSIESGSLNLSTMLTAGRRVLFPGSVLAGDLLEQRQQRTGGRARRPGRRRRNIQPPEQLVVGDAQRRQTGFADVVEQELAEEADAHSVTDLGGD